MQRQIIYELTTGDKNDFLECIKPIWYYKFEFTGDIISAVLRIIKTSKITKPVLSEQIVRITINMMKQEKNLWMILCLRQNVI